MTHPYYRQTGLYTNFKVGRVFIDRDHQKWLVKQAEVKGGFWHLDMEKVDG